MAGQPCAALGSLRCRCGSAHQEAAAFQWLASCHQKGTESGRSRQRLLRRAVLFLGTVQCDGHQGQERPGLAHWCRSTGTGRCVPAWCPSVDGMAGSPVLRIPDVAKILKISRRTVQKLIKNGTFPAYRVGRLVFLDLEEVVRAIKAQSKSAGADPSRVGGASDRE